MSREDRKPYTIHSQHVQTEHDIYLSDAIESDAFQYEGLYQHLNSVGPNDTVRIHLANFGGACHTGIRLINMIKTCEAHVEMCVTAPCYSMGAMIAICGSGLYMWPGTFLMFHNYSTVEAGKAGEVVTAVNEYQKMFRYVLDRYCHPFLSKKEIEKLCRDEDVYVHSSDKDMEKRLKRHYKV